MDFPAHQILMPEDLADLIRESNKNGSRFCFILGSGASVESGIPSGGSLEMTWMNDLMGEGCLPDSGRAERTRRKAVSMKDEHRLKFTFNDIENEWRRAKEENRKTLPSQYYFDIYRLRFHPDKANGYRYMEQLMEKAEPSIGYHTLSLLLTKTNLNNLLITTNFDSLVEDALSIYSDKKPLVIAHESLAGYIELDTKRPIIAKIHRGLFFEPFNSSDETNTLRKEWREALSNVFQRYSPIIIGYGGGDDSLMSFLKDPDTRMRHGLYWCIREGSDPDESIKALVAEKEGCFIEIKGFDGLMLELGRALYGDAVIPTETEKLLKAQYEKRMQRYIEQFTKLTEKPELAVVAEALHQEEAKEAAKREEIQAMTAWDYFVRASQKVDAGQRDEAIADYSRAIDLNPNESVFYGIRGYTLNELGRYEEAIQDLTKAIELDPYYTVAYINRAYSFSQQKQYIKAIRDCDKAIDLNPNTITAYLFRGDAFYELGEYRKALSDYSKAVEISPNDPVSYLTRGSYYNNTSHYEEAISDFNKAIDLAPSSSTAYNNRGLSLFKLKKYEEALSDYNKAIELDPYITAAYINRGNTHMYYKEFDAAITDFSKAIDLDNNINAYIDRGNAYNSIEQHEKAISDYSQAIKLDPSNSTAYNNRGFVYNETNRIEDAISDYNKAIELDPLNVYAYNFRGTALIRSDRFEDAILDFNKAIEIEPNKALSYNNRGIALNRLKRYEEAIIDCNRAIELDPDFHLAYLTRSIAFHALGKEAQANADLAKADKLAKKIAYKTSVPGTIPP